MRSFSLTICAALFSPRSSRAFLHGHHHSRLINSSNSNSNSNSNMGAAQSLHSTSSSASPLPPLLDTDGSTPLSPADVTARLSNKRVAYYFAAGWCPMCTRFEPSLVQFRDAANESGKPVEIIYVASDRTDTDRAARASAMGVLSVPFGESADELKKKYKVWAGSEALKLGFGRRSGVPALVVLSKNSGDELSFVAAESQGVNALGSWPLDDENGVWGE